MTTVLARLLAGLTALAAWLGIGLHLYALLTSSHPVLSALWMLLAYFTITTNLLVAVVFTGIAARRAAFESPWLVAGTALSIVLVGIVYGLLLRGLRDLTGGSEAANILLHMTTPVLAPLFWLAFVRKGALTWRDPLLWMLYPLAYLAYALIRSAIEGHYPYPFIDVLAIGWLQTARNAVVIALGFIAGGEVLVWLDRRLARQRHSW